MHTIKNPHITAILDDILQDIRAGKDDAEARKFGKDGSAIMPFSIDFLFKDSATAPGSFRFAFSHYYKQNGDMVPDPDMEVLYFPDTKTLAAVTFQDYRSYETAQPEGPGGPFDDELSRKLTVFLRTWLNNVVEQQGLKDTKPPAGPGPQEPQGIDPDTRQFFEDIKKGNRGAKLPSRNKKQEPKAETP